MSPQIEMEQVSCCYCGSAEQEFRLKGKDRYFSMMSEHEFVIVQCKSCGLFYLNPRPSSSSLALFYPDQYYGMNSGSLFSSENLNFQDKLKAILLFKMHHYPESSLGLPAERLDFINKRVWKVLAYLLRDCSHEIHRIPPYVANGKMLDVGCGQGDFMMKMKTLGWEVYGVEISEKACRVATSRGLRVHLGDLHSAECESKIFDAVCMHGVIEHLPNPVETLKEISRILKPGGYLVVNTQNIASLNAFVFRSYWHHLDVPRHLYHFTPKTLRAALECAGLHLKKVVFDGDANGMTISMIYLLNELTGRTGGSARWPFAGAMHFASLNMCRNSVWRGLATFFKPLTSVVAWTTNRFRLGDIITVVAVDSSECRPEARR